MINSSLQGNTQNFASPFEKREPNELPHIIAANRQKIKLIGSVKLFVRLDEHKYRKMVQFFVIPAEYDVCLLGLSSLRGLHWVGSQWPRDIPEVNSDEGKKIYKIRGGGRSTSSSYSEEEEQTSRRTKRFKRRAVQLRE